MAYMYIYIYIYIFHTSSHTSQKSRMGFGIKRRYDIHDPQERLHMSGPPKRASEFLSFPSPALGDLGIPPKEWHLWMIFPGKPPVSSGISQPRSSLIEGFLESYELRMSFDLAKEFK